MVKGRFAPSPSGRMHLGNVLCCLLAWLSAKQQGGSVLLRIEDLDTARCPRRYAEQLMDDLLWLGLPWDEGPGKSGIVSHGLDGTDSPDKDGADKPEDTGRVDSAVRVDSADKDGAVRVDRAGRTEGGGSYYQSERTALYQSALERLDALGLVYPCFCTRAELHAASAPHREDGQPVYPGTCRRLTREQAVERARVRKPALRLKAPDEDWSFPDGHMGEYRENLARECGDFLLRRSDGLFAYQLAVVVDDAAMGVTEVVRGADLLSSTPRQLYLYHLLESDAPVFRHFPLLLSSDGQRLSKRNRSLGLAELRETLPPEEILGRLAYLAGFCPTPRPASASELLAVFDWEKVPRRDIRLPEGLF